MIRKIHFIYLQCKALMYRCNVRFFALATMGLIYGIGQVSALSNNYFQHYSSSNGLSQNDVRTIYQDRSGFIWAGSHDGLNRFDGYTFTVFRNIIGDSTSISSGLIHCITGDSDGNIWIGTADRGVSKFDIGTQKFTNFFNEPAVKAKITDNTITCIKEDRYKNIWVGTANGLNRFVPLANGKYRVELYYSNNNSESLYDNSIMSLFLDSNGNFWIGTSNGLNRLMDEKNNDAEPRFVRYPNTFQTVVSGINELNGQLIIVNGKVHAIPFTYYENSDVMPELILDLRCSKVLPVKDELWCINFEGVFVARSADFKTGTFEVIEHFTYDLNNSNSLSNNKAISIMRDMTGLIWIGTIGGGINVYNPNRNNFRHFKKTNISTSISSNAIRSLFEDSKHNFWVITQDGHLNFLQGKYGNSYNQNFENIVLDPNSEGADNIQTIAELKFAKKSLFVLGSRAEMIFELDRDGKLRRLPAAENKLHEIMGTKAVFCTFVDSKKNLWIGTYGAGLFRIQYNDNAELIGYHHYLPLSGKNNCISSKIIRSIVEDKLGNIWIGTDNGLNRILAKDNSEIIVFDRFLHDDNNSNSLSHNYILPLLVGSDSTLWIGTFGGGLNKYIQKKGDKSGRFEVISSKDGLPNDVIKALLEDESGNLWISTNQGLSCLNKKTGTIHNFGSADGLQDMEFSEMAAVRRHDGEMVFGGVNGFNAFYSNDIFVDTSSMHVVLTGFTLFNQDLTASGKYNGRKVLEKSINCIDKLVLKYDENSFSFQFSALHFAAPAQNKYEYKLEGFDDGWTRTDAVNRVAKYTNVPSGDYILRIRATNGVGVWSKNELALPVKIGIPYWRSAWAFLIYFGVMIFVILFFRKYTLIKATLKNELILDYMEKEKVEELNSMKFKFFTNISHEFRTPLTLIIGFADRLINNPSGLSEEDRQKYYRNIQRNSRVLLNLINQLLGFRKVEQGKIKLKVAYGNISNYISMLGDSFYEIANRKEILFSVKDKTNLNAWFDAEIVERIIYNLLSNAFKFTPNGGHVTLEVEKAGTYVEIIVRDTGSGIPPEVEKHIFERFNQGKNSKELSNGIGLSFTKSLVELHHGEISYQSKVGEGTSFKVVLPVTSDDYSESEMVFDTEHGFVDNSISSMVEHVHESALVEDNDKAYTILLVEDNNDILYFLEENFKSIYNIFLATDGNEALNICLQNTIDLVVSDIMMDGMDGLEFCSRLKRDDRINHIPVILLTAKEAQEDRIKGYAVGADAYVTKPFSVKELETIMSGILKSRTKIIHKFQKNVNVTPEEVTLTSIDEKFIKRVKKYLEENISNSDVTVEMLADYCGISLLNLNKKLKAVTGFTVNSFIRNFRLQRAAQLLQKNMYSVNDVMYEVGYNDAKYFRGCFKKAFNMTPTEYRKKFNANAVNLPDDEDEMDADT